MCIQGDTKLVGDIYGDTMKVIHIWKYRLRSLFLIINDLISALKIA